MDSKEKKNDLVSGTFTWKIDGFSKLIASDELYVYSEVFIVGGFKWRVLIYPKGDQGHEAAVVDFMSMFLEAADTSTLPVVRARYAEFRLTVVNQVQRKLSKTEYTEHMFTAKGQEYGLGYESFMCLSEIRDPSKGFLVNDTFIVEAEIFVRKSDITILENETGELVDFKGVANIELAFHPLVEEVCLLHPMLIESQRKRSRTYVECAFTTLGRLLHFLKTTKVKDLNQDGYERLQHLWDELEAFKFDLAWLQPHIHSVHDMKNMAGRVDRMREDVKLLENEIKKRRGMLAAAEADIERAKEDLASAEKGFVGVAVADSVVGYPLA